MDSKNWTETIKPKGKLLSLNLNEVWKYRDLIVLFVKRDFVSVYKQTVLGPLWYIIQPVITTITFTIVFGNFAEISTDGLPPTLFYMAGVVPWGYFSSSLNRTSNTFTENSGIFGKVYFPRLTVPFSIIFSNLISFFIQFALLTAFITYYHFAENAFRFELTANIIFLPILVLVMGIFSLGLGLIVSSLTTKYKDFKFLLTFGIQLFMYATPVIYPLSEVPERFKSIIMYNPMVGIIENFKNILLKQGEFDFNSFTYSLTITIIVFILGGLIFSKTERSFIDTI